MFKLSKIIAILLLLTFALEVKAQSQESSNTLAQEGKDNDSRYISVKQQPFKATIEIPFKKDSAVAAYIRGNKLWIIFDEYKKYNYDEFGLENNNSTFNKDNYWIKSLSQQELDQNNTFLVVDLFTIFTKTPQIKLTNNDGNWIFEISENISQSNPDINVVSKPNELPFSRVEIEVAESINAIDFIDPFVGDNLLIVPMKSFKQVSKERRFVDFNIFKSIQGIAIRKISDEVAYSANGDVLYISSDDITTLSAKVIPPKSKVIKPLLIDKLSGLTSHEKGIINLRPYMVKDANFNYENYKLMHGLGGLNKDENAAAYTKLALLYLANDLYKEANLMLKIIKQSNYDYSYSYKFKLLEVIINFMNKRYDDAFIVVKSIDTTDIPINFRDEIRFWQSIIAYASGNTKDYILSNRVGSLFENISLNFLSGYTPNIITELAIITIDNKVANKQFKVAEQIVNSALDTKGISEHLKNRLNYITAKYYLSQNQEKVANPYLDECIANVFDTLNRTLCRFEKVKYQLDHSKINPEEAIDELDKLTYIWRGDQVEINILDYLGNLYNKNDKYIEALKTWNKIAKYYPNSNNTMVVQRNMSETFIKFFLNSGDEKMAPLEVLGIFYEFKDLIPLGDTGDKIISKFIDSLIRLDLLDRAAAILNYQVLNRLTGLEREEAINKLAKIDINNLKPELALEILALGDKDFPMVNALVERKYIKAEALYLTRNYNQALDDLKNDYSQRADDIKADIYWDLQYWNEFNNYSEPYLYSIINKNDPLSEKEVKRVLKQAVSYIITERKDLLAELYKNFKGRMPQNTAYSNVLKILSEALLTKPGSGIIGAQDIANYKAIVDNLVQPSGTVK
ncbi:hypothetical protein I862_04640 [endosymbiont of Acanthamoeba sp. UWC8]|uniref:hypothetical protein n=1 Tax=endosymbiont of Acanthamoeba sp. UWC8 TaxID=86106 RepID=UPI0004D1D6A2|nr:hypothetical protein [endosymbiont of Acanthamoeba sp. UWC8]AIF81486.1 hypothetical protein I862_04640 [endosymbiont of Acanthamoeba sp. UWC8]